MALQRKWIASPNFSSRGGKARIVVVHTAEGANTIEALGNFFGSRNVQASSHAGIDDQPGVIAEYVRRDDKAWTQANANPYSVSAELCAFAKWDRAEWLRHPNMLANTSAWIHEECAASGIPFLRIGGSAAQSGGSGVCGHVDLGPAGGGHWDPGPGFPWDVVMSGSSVPSVPAPPPVVIPPGLNAPVVGICAAGNDGYWMVGADGGIFSFGEAQMHGSMGGKQLSAPIVGMARAGNGYWLVAADGGVFCFGDAQMHGSMGGKKLNAPVIGMAATKDAGGYILCGADGGVFCFGNAPMHGGMGGQNLAAPIEGIARVGDGYVMAATDGGVFAFNTSFEGSAVPFHPSQPIVGVGGHPGGKGYWLLSADGGIFSFGAPFAGSTGGIKLSWPAIGMAPRQAGGYWVGAADGGVFCFGSAPMKGSVRDHV